MKRGLLIALGLFVLLVGALVIVPGFVGWDAWRKTAESRIKTATGFDAHIDGGISLRLIPSPSLSVADVRIGPPGSEDPILSFDRAAVHVRFMPLLQGRVEVDSVTLKRPRIHMLTLADGQNNWMTPEISLLLKGNAPAPADAAPAQKGLSDLISLDHVGIEDGAFRYKNLQTGSEILVEAIDSVLKADSLSGPLAVDGRLTLRGTETQIRGKTGRFDDLRAVPLDLELTLPKENVTLRYAGLASLSAPFALQGETGLSLADPAKTVTALAGSAPALPILKKSLDAKGLLTFADGSLAWKDLTLKMGDMGFTGHLDLQGLSASAPVILADFKATTPIDFDAFLPTGSGTPSQTDGFLPEKLPLPDGLNGQIKLSAPRGTYQGQSVKGLVLTADHLVGKPPTLSIDAAEIPGKTSLQVKGVWNQSSGGPAALDVWLNAKAGYLPETVKFLLGKAAASLPAANAFETGSAQIVARISPDRVSLNESTLTLGDLSAALKGSYAPASASGGRAKASVAMNVTSLDVDALSARLNPPGSVSPDSLKPASAKSDPVAALRALSLPFDVTFDLGASNLTWQKQKATGARLSGSLIGKKLTIESAGAENWYGASFNAAGKIDDLSKLDGINLVLNGAARNAQSVLDALQLNSDAFPRPFGAAEAAVKLEGNAQSLRFGATLKALRGSAEASGGLSDLLNRPFTDALTALTVRVTHPNLGDLMRMVRKGGGTSGDRTLDRPVDLYAKLDRQADTYKVSELKANLGPLSVSGDLALSTAGARPTLSGKLQTGNIPLDSFMGVETSAGPSGIAPGRGGSSENVRWSRNAIDTGWMRAVDMDLGIRATRLRYKGWDLSDPSFTLTLRDGTLTIPDLKSGIFNGTLALSTTVRSPADPRAPLSIGGKAAVQNVGIESVLHAFTGSLPLKAQGNISLNTDIATSGISMAALVNALNGKGDISGKDIVLEGVDLPRFARALSSETKPGDTLQGFWKGATSGGSTRFDSLNGRYTIEEGVIKIAQLLFDGTQTSIDTTGSVDLPRWTISLKNHITLKNNKEVPPFDVTVSGPLDNPANTFGAGVMQDYFARKLNRKIENLIQDKLGDKLQDKLGIPGLGGLRTSPNQTAPSTTPPVTDEPAPSPSSETDALQPPVEPAPSQPAPQNGNPPKPEDLFKDVLRGLAR